MTKSKGSLQVVMKPPKADPCNPNVCLPVMRLGMRIWTWIWFWYGYGDIETAMLVLMLMMFKMMIAHTVIQYVMVSFSFFTCTVLFGIALCESCNGEVDIGFFQFLEVL